MKNGEGRGRKSAQINLISVRGRWLMPLAQCASAHLDCCYKRIAALVPESCQARRISKIQSLSCAKCRRDREIWRTTELTCTPYCTPLTNSHSYFQSVAAKKNKVTLQLLNNRMFCPEITDWNAFQYLLILCYWLPALTVICSGQPEKDGERTTKSDHSSVLREEHLQERIEMAAGERESVGGKQTVGLCVLLSGW